jgi:hypothetical protein
MTIASFLTLLIFMIFCHIIDDFVLQAACLCKLKQKSFWKENASDNRYKHDYIVALLFHGFSWAFMIQLPLLIFSKFSVDMISFTMILIANMFLHAYIDHEKANKRSINLLGDQLMHMLQIIFTLTGFYTAM